MSNTQLTTCCYTEGQKRIMSIATDYLTVKIQLHTEPNLFDELHAEWNQLVQRSSANTVFSTWQWHYHWWNAYHPGNLWVFTVRDEQGQLVGIAPWFIEQHPTQGKRVRTIGSEDVTDYLDLIVDQDCQSTVYTCLAEALAQHRTAFDCLDLPNIPAASPTYTEFPAILEAHGFTITTQQQEVCPIIRLPHSFDAYLETILDGKQRGEIRRKLRKAEGYNIGGLGTLSWYIVGKDHDTHAEVERFMQLMALSHPTKAEFLTNAQHVKFFQSIVPAALEQGWLQLNFLVIDGEPAAAYLNFDYNNHILVYNSGLNPNKFAQLSPGIILLCYNIEHAILQQRATFDFLRGDEQYKYRMGAKDTPIYNLRAQ